MVEIQNKLRQPLSLNIEEVDANKKEKKLKGIILMPRQKKTLTESEFKSHDIQSAINNGDILVINLGKKEE